MVKHQQLNNETELAILIIIISSDRCVNGWKHAIDIACIKVLRLAKKYGVS